MKPILNILHLEDDPFDASLIRRVIEKAGIQCSIKVVDTRDDFTEALNKDPFDIILSDHALPSFDGISAIEMARASNPDIPLILLSGTLGEELVVEALKSGATDYVLKERIARLVPAMRRAMKEVEERNERRRLEAQFIESQKLEVLGQLAGGVAHDFNNILGVILGYSETVLAELEPGSECQAQVEEIRLAAERAVGLTQQLLVFSRKQPAQPKVLDLNTVVESLEKMLRRLIDEDIELRISHELHLGRIEADPGQLGQVIMNLAINARDAMPRGGKLEIETSNAPCCPDTPTDQASKKSGGYVVLTVRDNGEGMTEEVKANLFKAFFTTKPKGQGTGLGLATVDLIVQQCGGKIQVESSPGNGTTFRIFFPRVEGELVPEAEPALPTRMCKGTETILLVEDNLSLARLAGEVLRKLGYTVLQAANGQEGLRMVSDRLDAPVSLVVTDVIMPLMAGDVMAEWLRTTHPDIKVLYTSGYTDAALSHHGVLADGVSFLPKPYTPSILAHKVREMLDRAN